MCGLCGELRFDQRPVDLNLITKMNAKLARRGPDHEGHWSDGCIAFGHRRLSIIDLTSASDQPMIDEELGLVLVFNGAIYNYPELRKELIGKGYQFQSSGDTEVILKAFHAWGVDCVSRLIGMFAFVIWDSKDRSLFMARDRFGIKPLYYSRDTKRLRFASNSQALLATGDIDTSINSVGLHNQLTLHAVVPAPNTILNGLNKLAPATWMHVNVNGKTRQKIYWRLDSRRPEISLSNEEWVDAIHTSLRQSVKRRLEISDVPVGVLLSGGIDSSLLVALLAEAGASNLHTFSVGFEDVADECGNEFFYSDQVVEMFGTQHHRFLVPNDDVLKRLPEAVEQMSEPMVGQDAVAFFLLGEQVSQEVKVVQSGQGADEVFGGYFWYPRMASESGLDVMDFGRHYFDRDHPEFLESVTAHYRGEDHTALMVQQRLAACRGDEFIDRVLNMDVTMLVVDDPVKRVDNMTMAWGLEARVPFLDHELVELAAQMPPALKLRNNGKAVLKTLARGLIPDAVIDRPKAYFPMPALKYVRGDFLDFMRNILDSSACRQRDVYDRVYIKKLLSNPEGHLTRLQGSKLWHMALLEFWLQTHVDSAA